MTNENSQRRRTTEPIIIAIYRPDMTRQVQALRLILDVRGRRRVQPPGEGASSPRAVEP